MCLCVCVFVDGPRISCESTSAYVGDRDVYLRCRVRAKPPPVALYWVLDYDNSSSSSSSDISSAVTRLSQAPAAASAAAGHYGQDYWTVATVRISDIISSLSLSLCHPSSISVSTVGANFHPVHRWSTRPLLRRGRVQALMDPTESWQGGEISNRCFCNVSRTVGYRVPFQPIKLEMGVQHSTL